MKWMGSYDYRFIMKVKPVSNGHFFNQYFFVVFIIELDGKKSDFHAYSGGLRLQYHFQLNFR